jgi:hypothetical protein
VGHVIVQPPPAKEQLDILVGSYPGLAPVLPTALATLHIVRIAAGQDPSGEHSHVPQVGRLHAARAACRTQWVCI